MAQAFIFVPHAKGADNITYDPGGVLLAHFHTEQGIAQTVFDTTVYGECVTFSYCILRTLSGDKSIPLHI